MLGPLEAWHDGEPVSLGDQQQRYFLVVLLLHANRPLSPERLAEVIWPGRPKYVSQVRQYISRLRTAFRDADDVAIEKTPTGYVLRVADKQVDVTHFQRLCEAARGAGDRAREIELLRAAVALRRGRFLEDIDIDRVGGSDVVFSDQAYFDAVGDLAELELDTGDHRSARDRLRGTTRMDPTQVRHAALLMRALIAGGDHRGARSVFAETEAAVGEDLNPVLRTLVALAERGEPVSSLPSRPGGFTGRKEELAEIEAAAAMGRGVVWVSGAPGVGKSGLAVEVAHRMRDRFPDGQLLVRLNGHAPNVRTMTTEDALSQLLVEMGLPAERVPATLGRKCALYQALLHDSKRLVVLDNAESAEHVRALLPQAPGCFVIVTSRRMGEPDTGEHIRLAPLPPDEAVELFRRMVDPLRVRGRSAELATVVKRCGYLPMAILVVAAQLRRHTTWPLEHLLGLLAESGPWRTDGDDLAAAVRMSYQQLDSTRQRMFRLFGHLPGPHLDVVGAAVMADCAPRAARAALDHLHEVCLVEEVAPERYQMLDPLKEFAAAEPSPIAPTEPRDALVRLHDYYLVTLTSAVGTAYPFDRDLQPTTDRRSPQALSFVDAGLALAWLVAERDNLVAAIAHAAANGLPGHAWRLAVLLWRYFHTSNQFEDWVNTLRLAREIVSDRPDDYGKAHVLLRLATAHDRLGQIAEARGLAQEALVAWERLGDVRGQAATLCALAIPTMELGEQEAATGQFETALKKYEQCADPRGQAHALSMLGHIDELSGDLRLALRRHEAAVPLLREVGHVQGLAHALNNLGTVQLRLGFPSEALDNHVEAYEHAEERGDRCTAAYALNYIGNVHRAQGNLTEAAHHHSLAQAVAADLSDADLRTRLHHDRGETALAMGNLVEARRNFAAALDLADSDGNRGHQAHAHHGLARTLHLSGKHADAVIHWRHAETAFADLGQPEEAEIRAARSVFDCACHQPD
ncbi:AfsR/SARP family transcriptional regulator [Actinokineospora enzanensis]|uniref:AfsR/SARP family transcriptional regulator n=1 Tax=Actinokineospora enzanensis TaxID=155975 RepID=UPI000376E687|nr:tetratricopeptide repeat protein [Actinokineospora enzanensis]